MFSAAVLPSFATCFCRHANGVAAAFLQLLLSYMLLFPDSKREVGQVWQLVTKFVGQRKGETCGSLT